MITYFVTNHMKNIWNLIPSNIKVDGKAFYDKKNLKIERLEAYRPDKLGLKVVNKRI